MLDKDLPLKDLFWEDSMVTNNLKKDLQLLENLHLHSQYSIYVNSTITTLPPVMNTTHKKHYHIGTTHHSSDLNTFMLFLKHN